jgi:cellobiose phosphorylase
VLGGLQHLQALVRLAVQVQVQLPDEDVARQINIWTPVQSVHTGRYSRSISQHAAGVRTMGFRDTCQDLLAVAYRKPQWASEV